MEIELKTILDFIAPIPPFDRIQSERLAQLPAALSILYLKQGQRPDPNALYIIRKGFLIIQSPSGELIGKLAEGDLCSYFCSKDSIEWNIQAGEDCLLYQISCQKIRSLFPEIADYIQYSAAQRLKQAVHQMQAEQIFDQPISAICRQPIIAIESEQSIQTAAQTMNEQAVSSLLITQKDQPVGLVTDKDFRQRCIAQGLNINEPVRRIMSSHIISIESDRQLFDALLLMSQHKVHHLPVMQNGKVIGMLSSTDLMQQEKNHPLNFSRRIHKAQHRDELIELMQSLPHLQAQLTEQGMDALHLGRMISLISDNLTQKLIQWAEQTLGPPPVPYAWLVAGSQARQEQSSHSDQDNALLIDDRVQPSEMDWFAALAKQVNDDLNECGFPYCPGGIMASHSQWCQPESVWQHYFEQWITEPEPKALMLSSIFVDLRVVSGQSDLLKKLRHRIIELTPHHRLFLAHLARNALSHRPPLGFFRDFVLIHDGQHNDTFDLKHAGIVPIVDLARIYALAEGIESIHTLQRLQSAAGTDSLSQEGAADLSDAFKFINQLRWRHQARQFKQGQPLDNYLSPQELSKLEREQLKDAFKIVQTMQSSLEWRYSVHQLG